MKKEIDLCDYCHAEEELMTFGSFGGDKRLCRSCYAIALDSVRYVKEDTEKAREFLTHEETFIVVMLKHTNEEELRKIWGSRGVEAKNKFIESFEGKNE